MPQVYTSFSSVARAAVVGMRVFSPIKVMDRNCCLLAQLGIGKLIFTAHCTI
jgi:hypothetical protein